MTDIIADDSASAEPVDAFDGDAEVLNLSEGDQGEANEEGDEEGGDDDQPLPEEGDGLVDWQDEDGKVYRVPAKVKDGLMIKAEFTRKTMEMADQRRAYEARQAQVEKTERLQTEFASDIAQLGALNARLKPYEQVTDWPTYLRTGGAEAQAHYAEMQAILSERNAFTQTLGQKVQQRQNEAQRETVEQIEAGRAELAKHIKGYGPATLDALVAFASPFGFGPEEIRQAEADPRSIRILHLAQIGHDALQARKKTQQLAQGQKTTPVQTLKGAGGRIQSRPDTDDFSAFERMMDAKAKAKR